MKTTSVTFWAGLVSVASAGFLASTTRYFDGSEGACGCGTSSGYFPWQLGISPQVYTAAGSQALFDTDGAGWCGGGCGKCYNLTSTGAQACPNCGNGAPAGTSIMVMVTNLCPYDGNAQWCPQVGAANQHGFNYHFDIMAQTPIFGDNAVVEAVPVPCPGQATSDWAQCVCFDQIAKDETPAGSMFVDTPVQVSAPASTLTSFSAQSSTSTTASHTSQSSTPVTHQLTTSQSASTWISRTSDLPGSSWTTLSTVTLPSANATWASQTALTSASPISSSYPIWPTTWTTLPSINPTWLSESTLPSTNPTQSSHAHRHTYHAKPKHTHKVDPHGQGCTDTEHQSQW